MNNIMYIDLHLKQIEIFLFFMQHCRQSLTIISLTNTTVAIKWDSQSEGTSITYRVSYYNKDSIQNRRQVRARTLT